MTGTYIPLAKPPLDKRDIDRAYDVLSTGSLVQGARVARVEEQICEFLGCDHAICMTNGTSTLVLSMFALGIGNGDEVIVPAFSYIASANAIEIVGAKPVFVDIDERTFNIKVEEVESKITSLTKAIMVVHEFGLPARLDEINQLCTKHDLLLIEDAACALGAEYKGRKIGSNSLIASFSFHPRKIITSGEGGIVVTNDDEVAHKLRCLRNHGNDGTGAFVLPGHNCRMTDFQAAILEGQIERLEFILGRRKEIAEAYCSNITSKYFEVPHTPHYASHSWQSVLLLCKNHTPEHYKNIGRENHIEFGGGGQSMPNQQYYKLKYPENMGLFPCSLKAQEMGLALPIFATMTDRNIENVIKLLNRI